MNYRFQKFTTIYPEFTKQFLANNPDHERLTYQELYDRFINTWYGLSNYYARHMETLGNQAQDLFASFEPLQKAWARENGVEYEADSWLEDITLAQVKSFQPDVIYLQDLYLFDERFRQRLREICPKETIFVGWRAAPTPDFSVFKDLDLILTCVPNFVENLKRNGANAALMGLAFEHTILETIKPPAKKDLDFTFIGTIGGNDGLWSERHHLIERLLRDTPLQIWSEHNDPQPRSKRGLALDKAIYRVSKHFDVVGVPQRLRGRLLLIRRGITQKDPTRPSLKERYPDKVHKPVFGVETYKCLGRSKIVFNSHIDCAEDYAGNVRLYETTGMGACLLTDWKVNLPSIFEPDAEVVTYRSIEECIEKVRYLLEHEEQRQLIASAGQKRTLRDHTYARRVEQVDEILKGML